jgi:hypothetical protein
MSLTPGGKFTSGVVDTRGDFLLVSTTPAVLVANLPPVLLIPVVRKIQYDPNVIFRGLGEEDSRRKPEAKNIVTLPL